MNQTEQALWTSDWAWSMPLIVLTVVIHVLGLGLFSQTVVPSLDSSMKRRHPTSAFIVVIGVTILVVTVLHAGHHLGCGLPIARGTPRRQARPALLAQVDDNLRARESVSDGALAAHWSDGGSERNHPVRADHGFSLRHDRAGLASRRNGMAT